MMSSLYALSSEENAGDLNEDAIDSISNSAVKKGLEWKPRFYTTWEKKKLEGLLCELSFGRQTTVSVYRPEISQFLK